MPTRVTFFLAAFAPCLWLAVLSDSKANSVAYDVSGTVSRILDDAYVDVGPFRLGDEFTGRVFFDLSATLNWFGYYPQAVPPAAYSVTIDGLAFRAIPG